MKPERVLLFVAGMFGVATSAMGGAGVMTTVVTPLSSAITYSTNATTSPARPALVTFVGYTVTITNAGNNTSNNVRFTGRTAVTDTAEKATFSSAEGASCTPSADLTSVECTFGQLRSGESVPTFALFFKAPVKVVNGASDGVDQDFVKFSGTTFYAEGPAGPNSPPQNSAVPWPSVTVTLGTFNPAQVKSAMPKSGGTFFTGEGALTTSTDPFAISVAVPPAPAYSTVELLESDVSGDVSCRSLGHFFKCYQSAITIPNVDFSNTSSYLTIVARVDASNIKAGTKIGDVLIQYEHLNALNVFQVDNVGLCASPTTPRADGIPCITKAVHYKNKGVAGWTSELNGDFEWTFLNLKNGLIKVF